MTLQLEAEEARDSVPRSPRRGRRRGLDVGLAVALVWLVLVVAMAIIPSVFAPYDPLEQHLDAVLSPPSSTYWLGTDAVGRDVLSRIVWGARPALIGVAIALVTTMTIGVLWGLVAGYVGGAVDQILMRIADVILAFPSIMLSIVVATVLGGTLYVTMVAVGLALSPSVARLMRSGAIVGREREYVESSRMYGYGVWHRMLRHVFPNAFLSVLVQLTIFAGAILLAQTGLGFLGIGVQPPDPSWGASLGESFRYLSVNFWMTFVPGFVVVTTVLSFYAVGDRLRDRFADPAR